MMEVESKKRLKLTAAIMALLTVLSYLSGCSTSGINDSELMRPPKATGEKAAIQEIIESNAGGDYTLKYPQLGDYRSAIITEDLNYDGTEEAIALYRSTNEVSSVNILFIKEVDGALKAVGTFKNSNSDVDRIYIDDIDGDGLKEVIVGWSSFIAGANQVTYYKISADKVDEHVIKDTYSDMVFCDITNDETKDLILLSTVTEDKKTANAKLYSAKIERDFKFTGMVEMNSKVTKYVKVQTGKVTEEVNGVFIDSSTANNNEILTEVIYFDKGKNELKNPLNEKSEDDIINITTRKTSTNCRDIDGDGIVEVPTIKNITSAYSEENKSLCPYTLWQKIKPDNGSLSYVCESVTNYTDGYYFILPQSWSDKILAVSNTVDRTMEIYSSVKDTKAESENKKDSNRVNDNNTLENGTANTNLLPDKLYLTFKVFTEKDWSNEENAKISEGYTVLMKNSGLVYTVKFANNTPASDKVDFEQIYSSFHLISGN